MKNCRPTKLVISWGSMMVLLCINIPSCNLLFAMKAMAQLQMIYGLLVLMIFSILKLPEGE